MNIFYEYEGIFGKAEVPHLQRTMEDFLALAKTIRSRLGTQAYLLDRYIFLLMESVNASLCYAAASKGFDKSSELRTLCSTITSGSDEFKEHPFYEQAWEYISAHPLPYQERSTRMDLYLVALSGGFLEHAAAEYYQRQKTALREVCDIIELQDLYQQISVVTGDEHQMEQLNLLFRQRFLIVTPMAAYLQGLTNDLLYSLKSRDIETGKLTFQLYANMAL